MRKYAHAEFGTSAPGASTRRAKMLNNIKDKNPRLVYLSDYLVTYAYEGDDMEKVRLPLGAAFYQMELDLDARAMYVHMKEHDCEIESVVSANGEYVVDFYWNNDGLPVVVGFEMLNQNKISIIQDWIEEGVEAAIDQLNEHERHDYGDNHWKGVLINEQT